MYEPSLRSPIPPNPGPVIYYNYMTYTDLDTVRLIFGDISALGIDVRRDIIKCIRKLPAKHAPNNPLPVLCSLMVEMRNDETKGLSMRNKYRLDESQNEFYRIVINHKSSRHPHLLHINKRRAPPAQLSKASIHPIISLSRDPHQPSTGCTSLGSRDPKGLITRPSRFPHPAQDTNNSNHNSHLSSHNNPLKYSLTPELANNLSTKTYFTHKPTTRPSQHVSV